jgi:hypothetical protein
VQTLTAYLESLFQQRPMLRLQMCSKGVGPVECFPAAGHVARFASILVQGPVPRDTSGGAAILATSPANERSWMGGSNVLPAFVSGSRRGFGFAYSRAAAEAKAPALQPACLHW